MLLEKLVEYANAQMADELPPAGYQSQPIRYVLDISPEGQLLGVLDTASKEKKRGEERLAPYVKRGIKIKAKLLADNGEYVLGLARDDPKKPPDWPLIVRRHQLFMDLTHACADGTGNSSVAAIARFLDEFDPTAPLPLLPRDFDAGANLTFRVSGDLPINDPGIRAWWAASRSPEDGGDGMSCIVCGTVGPVLDRHPLKIKRIPGSMTIGYNLISANSQAFESYGLIASMTAPTCAACAEAYGNALNALLADRATSLWSGGLAYAFWTDPKAPTNPFQPVPLFREPDAVAGMVAALLKAHHSGKTDPLFLDPTAFYCVALGSSGARVVVKDWIDSTVGHAREALARYFALQEMVDWNGDAGNPVPLFWLAGATVRRKETPPDVVTQALFRLALKGTPLPDDLLYMAVRRNRAEQDVTRPRAMLIRMVLDGKLTQEELKESTMAALDATRRDPAYVCGRQLAIIDRIQYQALGDVNASVIDKYFGSASSNPGLTFPILLRGAQFHLNKLARDKPGTRVNLQRELEETSALLSNYPKRLNLHEQGLFALGFYHQRAHDRAMSAARRSGPDPVPVEGTSDAA